MRRVLLIAMVVLACGVSETGARTTIIEPPGSHYPYQRWVDEAKVPTPNVVVTVREDDCPGSEALFACSIPADLTIWFQHAEVLRESCCSRGVFLHELGHVFDYAVMQDWARVRFARLVRRGGQPWAQLEERFADEYMGCALPRVYAATPRICRLVRGVAR